MNVGRAEKITFREVLGRWISGNEKDLGVEVEVGKLKDGLQRILLEVEGLKPPLEKIADSEFGRLSPNSTNFAYRG